MARWLTRCLVAAGSSPTVLPYRGTTKSGSYPKPLRPFGETAIRPYHVPWATAISPDGPAGRLPRPALRRHLDGGGSASANTQRYRARRRPEGIPCKRRSSFVLLAPSSPCLPENLADRTPGPHRSASTSIPESSATAGHPVARAAATAFLIALASHVFPVSRTTGTRPHAASDTQRMPRTARSRVSSRNLC